MTITDPFPVKFPDGESRLYYLRPRESHGTAVIDCESGEDTKIVISDMVRACALGGEQYPEDLFELAGSVILEIDAAERRMLEAGSFDPVQKRLLKLVMLRPPTN